MSFRLRVTLLAGAAVAIAVVVASAALVYVVVRHQLLGEVDSSLVNRAPVTSPSTPGPSRRIVPLGPRASLGEPSTLLQVLASDGSGAVVTLPGQDRAEKLAGSGGHPFFMERPRRGRARPRLRGTDRRTGSPSRWRGR